MLQLRITDMHMYMFCYVLLAISTCLKACASNLCLEQSYSQGGPRQHDPGGTVVNKSQKACLVIK